MLLTLSLWLIGAAALAQPSTTGPTLAFGGDVLFEAPLAFQLRRRSERVGREQAFRELFEDLEPAFERADFSIVNLEVPIAERVRARDPSGDGPAVFAAPEMFLSELHRIGVDAVTVANNHAFDQGVVGLASTLSTAAAVGVTTVGAGTDAAAAASPVFVEVEGRRIALLAWTEGVNHVPPHREGRSPWIAFLDEDEVALTLSRARSGADLVIAFFHWTHEDLVRPRALMRRVARRAAEAGADLVVGHGTHVPGRRELMETSDGRRVPVLYSLGNLVAAMREPGGTLRSAEVGVRDAPIAFVRTRARGSRLEVSSVELTHHWISRPIRRAPWLPGGSLPVLRPLGIPAELARLANARCGPSCDERADQLRRRVALVDRAMAAVGVAPSGSVRDASEARSGAPRPASAAPPSSPPSRSAGSSVADSPTPPAASATPAVLSSSPTRIPVEFPPGAVRERAVDPTVIDAIVSMLRADRSLRVEVAGHATEDEVARRPGLGRLRARRVMGLIAGRGPSRSRFEVRSGDVGRAGVTLRLLPRTDR